MCSWSVCSYILSNHSLQSCSNPFWYIILYQYQRIDPLRPNQQQWCITLQLHHQCISMVTEWMPLTQSHNEVFDFKKCINHLAQIQSIEMVWWYWNNWRKCIFDWIIMQVIFFYTQKRTYFAPRLFQREIQFANYMIILFSFMVTGPYIPILKWYEEEVYLKVLTMCIL